MLPATCRRHPVPQHGPGTVPRHGPILCQNGMIQPLAPDALDRVPPYAGKARGHVSLLRAFLSPEIMLPNTSGLYPWLRMM